MLVLFLFFSAHVLVRGLEDLLVVEGPLESRLVVVEVHGLKDRGGGGPCVRLCRTSCRRSCGAPLNKCFMST